MAVVLAGDWVCVSGGWVRPTVSLLQVASLPPRNLDFLPHDWLPGQGCYPLQRTSHRLWLISSSLHSCTSETNSPLTVYTEGVGR